MTYPSAPRIHGNGFIQVDLDELHRLHLWDVRIPRQRTDSSFHDHAFGFDSKTLVGTLVNVNVHPRFNTNRRVRSGGGWGNPTHNLYQVVRDPGTEETKLKSMRKRCWFEAGPALVVGIRDGYHMEPGQFHASFHLGTTVTYIKKDLTKPQYLGGLARVACRIGERPDNSWVREQEIPEWAKPILDEWTTKWIGP